MPCETAIANGVPGGPRGGSATLGTPDCRAPDHTGRTPPLPLVMRRSALRHPAGQPPRSTGTAKGSSWPQSVPTAVALTYGADTMRATGCASGSHWSPVAATETIVNLIAVAGFFPVRGCAMDLNVTLPSDAVEAFLAGSGRHVPAASR